MIIVMVMWSVVDLTTAAFVGEHTVSEGRTTRRNGQMTEKGKDHLLTQNDTRTIL